MFSKVPFERFILAFLILGKDAKTIIEKLKDFRYHIEEEEILDILKSLKNIVSEVLKAKLDNSIPWNINDEQDSQWLKKLEIYEYYDYLLRRKDTSLTEPPEYFKWFKDSLWIHAYPDIMALVNILMFNTEPISSISDIIMFRYKKKIGVEALERHKLIYWNCDAVSAKEALYHCIPFRKNALIVKNIKSANITEIVKLDEEADDGSDVAFVFHESNYIKWKIGYKAIEVPSAKDFLTKIKQDSYFKYYEAMNMYQSAETEEESGTNDMGPFDRKLVKRRNVEEQKAKAAKHWMDLYLKADDAMPAENTGDVDFFDKMEELSLNFDDEEKLMDIIEHKDISDDIRGDK